jgi:flagellar motor component MotA
MWLANVAREFISNILSAASYGRVLGWVAWAFIAFIGVIAALAQIGVANFVLGPVLNAVLFTIAGIAIVGIGGGMIQPMRSRWERMLTKAESETTRVQASVQQNALAYQKGRADARTGQPSGTQGSTQANTPYGREPGTTA